MEKNDRISRRHDFFNRYTSQRALKATSNWKMGDDILILRKNNTFRYYSKVFGLVNSGYYTGSYKSENNVISFKFHKNYKPAFFESDTLLVEQKDGFFILKCKKTNNYLVIN
ncbi:hypothetical protein [Flavobacterium sangjuense]|nr:hypothetical protein [Flavobacterium sangjuense]